MKKILGTLIMALGVCGNILAAAPVELKEYKQSTYNCAYFDWWYFGYSEASYFGYTLFDANGAQIAFTVMSQSETDMCAYYDNVQFPQGKYEDRDDEAHYYMSTYWVLNSPNGVRFGDNAVVAKSVAEVSDGSKMMYALRSGKYYFSVTEVNFVYDPNTGEIVNTRLGGSMRVDFEIDGVELKELKAEVASDKKTATITWTVPAPEDMPAGAHLYIGVKSGAEQVLSKKDPVQPLVIDVTEGRSYTVVGQYVTSKDKPLGTELVTSFTVGVNPYVPTNLKATVISDDNVEFTWEATTKADYYGVDVYQNGFLYKQYTANDTKLSKTLPTGTYTWKVAAFEKGTDGYGYAITDFIAGNEFTTESAPLPEGVVEMSVFGMNAMYMDDESSKGRYAWVIVFETGSPSGTGLPEPWFAIYSDRELAISGDYSPALGNLDISTNTGEGSLMNTNGSTAGLLQATDAKLTLNFEGFDTEYIMAGYSIPYYSGEFTMTCTDGNTYYGKINSLICPAFPWEEMNSDEKQIISMLGEDENYHQGIEDVQGDKAQSSKYIVNGQLIIERNGVKYNAQGAVVK